MLRKRKRTYIHTYILKWPCKRLRLSIETVYEEYLHFKLDSGQFSGAFVALWINTLGVCIICML